MAELLSTDQPPAATPRRPASALLHAVVTWWAIAGGLVFCAIVAMSIVSIVGRKLFASPVEGDMELLMMLAAVGSAAFLPLCELEDHHIKVDALTTWMSDRGRAALDLLAHLVLAVGAAVITWRTQLYVQEVRKSMEMSPILLVPMWIPVLLLVPSFVLLTVTALYRAGLSLRIAMGGRA